MPLQNSVFCHMYVCMYVSLLSLFKYDFSQGGWVFKYWFLVTGGGGDQKRHKIRWCPIDGSDNIEVSWNVSWSGTSSKSRWQSWCYIIVLVVSKIQKMYSLSLRGFEVSRLRTSQTDRRCTKIRLTLAPAGSSFFARATMNNLVLLSGNVFHNKN